MKISVNIIAPNIKTGGGKELLEYLIEYISIYKPKIYLTVYLDVSLKNICSQSHVKVHYLRSSFEKIKLFNKKIDNAIYFGNLPPLKKSENSMVYFHNPYLLMDFNELRKTSLKFFVKYILQKFYIKHFIKNVDVAACQNEEIQKSFINIYSFENVKLLPFFRLCDNSLDSNNTKKYDFCYVSLAHPHKNHIRLLEAIEILSNKNISVTLALTIEGGHDDLVDKINSINKKSIVHIVNLGLLSKNDVCKLYSQSKALIFPSTQETFGLALIEAVEMGLDIIASDLEYVYKVIKPSLVFNPYNTNEIAHKLQQYIEGKNTKSESRIENKIEELINTIIKGVR